MKTSPLNETLFFSKTNEYLNVYLPKQAAKSDKTIKTYSDALTVFRRYLYEERGISIRSFKFEECTRDLLLEYLAYLKKDHKATSCNNRMAAIKSYLWYVADGDISMQSIALMASKVPRIREPKVTREIIREADDVSFDVRPGERVGIIGRNGAGKSTLLKLISRVTAPSKGWIGLNGRVASMLEVGTGFHQELTGRENIYLNGAILGMTRNEIDEKIEDIIEFSECRLFIDTPVKRYSSGMYVKLAFSVAAHLDSDIMIMDEVLAVGDVAFQKKCLEKMAEVSQNNGRTILYVSHNMPTIRTLCNRCIVLDKGKLIYDGDVQQGIDTYMQTSFSKAATMNDVSDRRRRYVVGDHIRIQSIELVGKETPSYVFGEKMLLRFVLKVKSDLKIICARMEISTLDGIRVGTTLAESIGDVEPGTEIVTLVFETGQIIPGQYYSTIVFYQKGANGKTINHDCVENAFVFEIEDTEKRMPLTWMPENWGRVVLKGMEVVEKG